MLQPCAREEGHRRAIVGAFTGAFRKGRCERSRQEGLLCTHRGRRSESSGGGGDCCWTTVVVDNCVDPRGDTTDTPASRGSRRELSRAATTPWAFAFPQGVLTIESAVSPLTGALLAARCPVLRRIPPGCHLRTCHLYPTPLCYKPKHCVCLLAIIFCDNAHSETMQGTAADDGDASTLPKEEDGPEQARSPSPPAVSDECVRHSSPGISPTAGAGIGGESGVQEGQQRHAGDARGEHDGSREPPGSTPSPQVQIFRA